jgi:hypothetical protein
MASRFAWLLGCAALLAGCGDAGRAIGPEKPERPNTQEQCRAKGGEWILYPMGQFHFCVIRTSDSGKACSDDGQCQGDCVPVEHEAALPGACAPTLPLPGGCPKHLVDGKVVEEPCI